ncbi:hypothetical protein MMC13_003607 [Lambiella insularis]|nr:hypothetical protein [Lambiella insularis]
MSAQQDPTPWTRPMSKSEEEDPAVLLNGRAYFSELGVVRRKPSRADSPATLSKSCSDKLALKQCTSLLSTAATVLISPENAYLDTLILPASRFVPSACERAFGAMGRMQSVAGKRWSGGYSYRPFKINSTSREFEYSNCGAIEAGLKSKPLNISALWTSHLQETLINGVLQGRKQADPKGGSAVCRLKLSHLVLSTLACLALPALAQVVASPRYADLKAAEALQDRKQVKKEATSVALRGWLPNVADDFDIHIE